MFRKFKNIWTCYLYISFKETVIAMGLVERDEEIFNILDEACTM